MFAPYLRNIKLEASLTSVKTEPSGEVEVIKNVIGCAPGLEPSMGACTTTGKTRLLAAGT